MQDEHEFDFESDVAIDLDDLHMEWADHAHRRYRYAVEVSYLKKKVDQAQEQVKIIRSHLIHEAKEMKLSSADLREAYYREHENYIAAREAQIDAEYKLAMAWNALQAMDDRKFALENEVELWKRNYFAPPREHRSVESGKRIEDMERDKKVQKQRETMNRRRRKQD